jgi:hypothetical protein
MKFTLQTRAEVGEVSGDVLANIIRKAASVFDDPTEYFDDPTDESGFDRSGQVLSQGDLSIVFDDGQVVATWNVEI